MDFVEGLRRFSFDGVPTGAFEQAGLRYFVNAFWTAGQRRGHSLHEISYRACFKGQLPGFFIERLTEPGDRVFDPFSGRGTTAVQAALLGRAPVANDVNPLSAMLCAPRLDPPSVAEVRTRLAGIDLSGAGGDPAEADLLAFYHPDTLRQIRALRGYLLNGGLLSGGLLEPGVPDAVDQWIRMVAINRLTGHSNGFFSVYTMPPNQAVSAASQRRINAARGRVPPPRDVRAIILKKTVSLLADGAPPLHPPALLLTGAAEQTPGLADASVDLIVTSPPFLDVVDYAGDNWLRCWFAGIDAGRVRIDRHRDVLAWQGFVRRGFAEFARVVRPGGFVAFEVGEVRGGRVLLERHVVAAIEGLPFDVLGVMVNQQSFTKTANCWGVGNNRGGTNTNRIVMAVRR
ncbi:DNA methyltransferase [Rhodopila sp.]|uniref:DNA methyltransferase n=1 Tax=Rhodopila sp. TaxID=2480087 RepID=UPI003D12FAA0